VRNCDSCFVRRSGRVVGGLLCAIGLAAPVVAETPQERGKRIVNECVEALGGARYMSLHDLVQSGRAYSFYREKLSGLSIARIALRYLNKVEEPWKTLAVLEREDFGKKLDYGLLFQQDEAYDITFRGARPLADERFQRYRRSTLSDIFYILRERLKEPGLIFESRGADVWGNNPVEIVDITDARNQVVTVYFHRSTKLPVNDEETVYTKYREVDGIQWPLTIQRSRNGEKIYEMFCDSLEVNKNLPDKMFDLPAGMKKLKPE
jgi:hypothetical protein